MRRWLAAGRAATSRITEVEIASALARRVREGSLAAPDRDRAIEALLDDLTAIHVVELTPEVSGRARELLARHRLRAGDALQLASALHLAQEVGESIPFVAFDDRLRVAAIAETVVTLPKTVRKVTA